MVSRKHPGRAHRPLSRLAAVAPVAPLMIGVAFAACGHSAGDGYSGDPPGSEAGAMDQAVLPGDEVPVFADAPSSGPPYADFPANPIFDAPDGGAAAAPPNAQQLFGGRTQGAQSGGPCLVEPEPGSLLPRNWLRPRFRWIAPSGQNLFELRVHSPNEASDLVVYTTQTSWIMPKAMWDGLRLNSNDVDMTVSIRGGVLESGQLTGEALGSTGTLGVAPADATGTIVYWTTSNGTALKGFSIGDETVGAVLTPTQVQETQATCVGCHTSTPDGKFAELTLGKPWSNAIASVEQGKAGQAPSFLGAGGKAALEKAPRGISTFSAAHWSNGDHVVVTTMNDADIGWIDLEAAAEPASGTFARTGDSRHAGAPAWSHDGTKIVYVSTFAVITGRLDLGDADLYSIPYANRAGGAATAITGASDPNYEEYYPAFSPDDALLAFDRAPNWSSMYNQPNAEVFVLASGGGTATRLDANDPPACTKKASPGVTNSWPKWAPSSTQASRGRTFYWLVFSSTRDEAANPQLYVTPVMVDGSGVHTYRALYLWNQPAGENNHTPAWDTFQLPPPPPPK